MKCLIKIKYRDLNKNYFIILFLLFIVIAIIIFWKFVLQNLLNIDKKNIKKNCISKKHILYQPSNIIKTNNIINNNIICLNILNNQSCLYKNQQLITIYNCPVLSSNVLLNTILQEYSHGVIDSNDVQLLTQKYPILKCLKSGQTLSCLIFNQKQIKHLIYQISSTQIHVYNNVNNCFTEGIIKILTKSIDGLQNTILFIGNINNGTFIDSARILGLEENCILDVIQALKYQVDFRKLRHGDKFSILISSVLTSDKKLQSKLVAARLFTAGKDYYIFQLSKGKFYNQKAIRLENNFMRFPVLTPYRISSNFNLNRLNPVTGQISPHAGVDFAIPVGTPVLSVGDGEVIVSKYSKIAGNYIAIKHNYQCITRYMHLKKILVKLGQKVKKGDHIGISGNTGRSTGPHLHFELWINHRPVNPLTAHVFNLDNVLDNERMVLLHQIEEIIPKLCFD